MKIPTKKFEAKTAGNTNRWEPIHEWEVPLECGVVTVKPANKQVDTCDDPVAIAAMIQNCHNVKENKAGNYTMYFNYGKHGIKVVAFVSGCKDTSEEDLLDMLHCIKAEEVMVPMSDEEAVGAWGVAV